jgi:Domain of unknown function (DUF4112)
VTKGEVVGRSRHERFQDAERRILRISKVMDDLVTVPGTDHRFGLDPIIGLIPVIGDAIGAVPGIYLISEAARFRIPSVVLARMTFNTMIDMAIGIIPFFGDFFDFFSKSNANNLALFRRYALEPETDTGPHHMFFLGLGLILIGVLWLTITIIAWFIGLLLQPFGL